MSGESDLDHRAVRRPDGKSSVRWHLPALILFWALIFLPALGGPEYKGEEPRRVQPALAMLGSGEWIVPQIGGEPYYNKPPLINWLVAFAFQVGGQSETSARAVSAVAILAMMLGLFLCSRGWLGPERALFAALAATTHVSMVDKGRLIEIEPLYITLFSLALALWLGAFFTVPESRGEGRAGSGGFALWMPAWIFLGLGVLTKGPVHLFFFYLTIIPVAFFAGRWRVLLSPWHFAGIATGAGIVAAWAVPLFQRIPSGEAVKTWRGQMASRIAGEPDRLVSFEFLLNLPKGLANFLPWTLLLAAALVFLRIEFRSQREDAGAGSSDRRAARLGLLAGFLPAFIVLGLIPGILPRYTMPLFTPAALWLASVLPPSGGWAAPAWRKINRALAGVVLAGTIVGAFFADGLSGRGFCFLAAGLACFVLFASGGVDAIDRLAARSVSVIAAAVLIYAAVAVPRMAGRDDVRPVAGEIIRRAGESAVICLIDPESRPFIAYLPPGVKFARRFPPAPEGVTHLIMKRKEFEELDGEKRRLVGEPWEFTDRGRTRFVLVELKKPLLEKTSD